MFACLCGCGRTDAPSLDSSAFGSGQTYSLAIGYGASESDSLHSALQELSEKVSASSNGAINIDLYSSEELGSVFEIAEQVRAGNLDGVVLTSDEALPYCPQISVLRLPFLFRNYGDVESVLNSDVSSEITEGFLDHQMVPIAFFGGALWQISNQLRPVENPQDLTGMMLHTTDDELTLTVYERFGALPAPLERTELAEAMQKKVFHGAVGSLNDLRENGLESVQNYLSVLNIQYDAEILIFSEETWDSLPNGVQKIISSCAAESGKKQRDQIAGSEEALLQSLSNNMEIIEPDRKAFKEISDPIYDQYISQNSWADELIRHIKKQIKEA